MSDERLLYSSKHVQMHEFPLQQGCGQPVRGQPFSPANHSHSIVAGGLLLTSYVTRLMPRTSLMMRLLTFFSSA